MPCGVGKCAVDIDGDKRLFGNLGSPAPVLLCKQRSPAKYEQVLASVRGREGQIDAPVHSRRRATKPRD